MVNSVPHRFTLYTYLARFFWQNIEIYSLLCSEENSTEFATGYIDAYYAILFF
jgi:hypothetical protein